MISEQKETKIYWIYKRLKEGKKRKISKYSIYRQPDIKPSNFFQLQLADFAEILNTSHLTRKNRKPNRGSENESLNFFMKMAKLKEKPKKCTLIGKPVKITVYRTLSIWHQIVVTKTLRINRP